MSQSRRVIALTVAVLAALPIVPSAPTPATAAAAGSTTTCGWSDEGLVEPGFSTEPSSGTYSTGGETGTITCDGPIQGQMPSGPGTIGFETTYGVDEGASCQSGGKGSYAGFFTLPTADGGRIHGVDFGTFEFGPLPAGGGVYGGTFQGEMFSGTFESEPVEGDCVTGVTKVSFKVECAAVAEPRKKVL